MDGVLEAIARCLDLQEPHIADAIADRERTKRLLEHLARISAPSTGVAKVLLVYARMATSACDWIDGDLCIDLADDQGATIADVCTELGGGLRERVFAPLRFDVPLSELARAIARVPRMIAPLQRRSTADDRIRLSAVEAVRRTTAPPPSMHIAADSLFVRLPPSRLPKDEGDGDVFLPLPVASDELAPEPRAASVAPAGESARPPEDVDAGWDE